MVKHDLQGESATLGQRDRGFYTPTMQIIATPEWDASATRPEAAHWAEARRHMVDSQLRPNRVTDPLLLAAMGELPRHLFAPASLTARAHADADLPLPGGRAMLQPMAIARLLQLLALRDGDRLLIVGAGTGYSAAIAASLGARVVALEQDEALVAVARRVLPGLLPPGAIELVCAPLPGGHPAGAPYDAILIEGEVPAVPPVIAGQLAEGGRLATILAGGPRGRGPRAVLGRRASGGFSLTDAFDCATAALRTFQPNPGFVL